VLGLEGRGGVLGTGIPPEEVARMGVEAGLAVAGGGVTGIGARAVLGGGTFMARMLTLLSRGAGAGVGAAGGSELFAPEGESAEDAFVRRSFAAGGGAAGEFVAPLLGLTRPLRRMFRVPKEDELLTPGSVEAQQVVRAARTEAGQSMRASLTPGLMRNDWVQSLEKIAEAGFGGSATVGSTRRHAARAAEETIRQSIGKFGASLDDQALGQVLTDALTGSANIARAATSAAYKALDLKVAQHAGARIVSLAPVNAEFQKKLATAVVAGDTKAIAITRLLDKFGEGTIGFKQAESVRQALLSMARPTEGDLLPDVRSLAKAAAKQVDDRMKVAGLQMGSLGDEVIDAFAKARATSAMAHETFGDEVIVGLLNKATPEQLTQALFVVNRPTAVAKVRNIVFNPAHADALGGQTPEQLWGEVQSSYLANATGRAGKSLRPGRQGFGELNGKILRNEIETGAGTWRELFPNPADRGNLLSSARAIELAQGKTPGREFSVFVQLTQAGAALRAGQVLAAGAVGGGSWAIGASPEEGAGAAFAILVAPWAIGKVLANRGVAQALLRLAQTKTRGQFTERAAAQASIKLVEAVSNTGVPFTFRNDKGRDTPFPEGLPQGSRVQQPVAKPTNKLQAPTR
jgi:hypothetical protein